MRNYLQQWTENILSRKSSQLNESFEISGERKMHLGARGEIAAIRVRVSPAESFQVYTSDLKNFEEIEAEGYLDAAVFGILDVLVLGESYPLTEVAISFLGCDVHPVESSRSAFRQAGRDAGRKILQRMREAAFRPPS